MRKLLNTLYVTTPESYLSKDGMNVVISVNQQEVFRIPIINIEAIVTFGYMGASPGLMKLCTDSGVSLTFLSPNGRFVSRVQGQTKGNVLLRKAQYRLADDQTWSLHLAQLMVAGKIQNYRNVLRRYLRDYGENPEVLTAANTLDIQNLDAKVNEDRNGYELSWNINTDLKSTDTYYWFKIYKIMKRLTNYWPFELLDGFFGTPGFIADNVKRERISETDDEFTIEISLPGFKKEDVSIKTSDGFLEIHGSCSRWDKVDYNKRYSLPDEIDATKIEAKLEDDILVITLPKQVEKPEEKENLIQIQ